MNYLSWDYVNCDITNERHFPCVKLRNCYRVRRLIVSWTCVVNSKPASTDVADGPVNLGVRVVYASFCHDGVIKWKHFPRYWPFVRGIHWSPVNSPHKSQWHGAWMFLWSAPWINGWINNREAGDLRRHRPHYEVIVMVNLTITNILQWNLNKIHTQSTLFENIFCKMSVILYWHECVHLFRHDL